MLSQKGHSISHTTSMSHHTVHLHQGLSPWHPTYNYICLPNLHSDLYKGSIKRISLELIVLGMFLKSTSPFQFSYAILNNLYIVDFIVKCSRHYAMKTETIHYDSGILFQLDGIVAWHCSIQQNRAVGLVISFSLNETILPLLSVICVDTVNNNRMTCNECMPHLNSSCLFRWDTSQHYFPYARP